MDEYKRKIKHFQDLIVWQKAHALVLDIYQLTDSFPSKEKFGIISQIRRAVFSIPTNLAEGGKRATRKDYSHFVNMAEGSLEETKYLLLLSKDLGYLKKKDHDLLIEKTNEIGKMLYGLRKSLA